MRQHYETDFTEGIEFVRDRLVDSLQLLRQSAISGSIYTSQVLPSAEPDRFFSFHLSALSSLSHISHSPFAFTTGALLHDFELPPQPPIALASALPHHRGAQGAYLESLNIVETADALSPEGAKAAEATADTGELRVRDLDRFAQLRRAAATSIQNASRRFSPDGKEGAARLPSAVSSLLDPAYDASPQSATAGGMMEHCSTLLRTQGPEAIGSALLPPGTLHPVSMIPTSSSAMQAAAADVMARSTTRQLPAAGPGRPLRLSTAVLPPQPPPQPSQRGHSSDASKMAQSLASSSLGDTSHTQGVAATAGTEASGADVLLAAPLGDTSHTQGVAATAGTEASGADAEAWPGFLPQGQDEALGAENSGAQAPGGSSVGQLLSSAVQAGAAPTSADAGPRLPMVDKEADAAVAGLAVAAVTPASVGPSPTAGTPPPEPSAELVTPPTSPAPLRSQTRSPPAAFQSQGRLAVGTLSPQGRLPPARGSHSHAEGGEAFAFQSWLQTRGHHPLSQLHEGTGAVALPEDLAPNSGMTEPDQRGAKWSRESGQLSSEMGLAARGALGADVQEDAA
eukprot:CAMPEP_0171147968 /NCGR_PEP_ID=MMETSP0766_2-20121228/148330_1 /TAXON_ID=439317 /ORGANISM="Gambierdiscus australes, Strain CAWD 149" /LENGTH=567 /DNA_ID=CAMNT_0011611877 /DNA_START=100 /DNA_END=1802 /DNA_ORIENTATION=+